nr:MAG TPA: hypothetical protein [Caudoviricetes sp.]
MGTGVAHICQSMADYLNQQEIPSQTAWPAALRKEQEGPVVVVALQRCVVEPSGFQDYLGERYDKESGQWVECYGRKARLTLSLDIYAPEKCDGQTIQQTLDTLAGALLLGGPEGLNVEEFSCGQTDYDSSSRRLRRPAQAVFTAYLCAQTQSTGEFTDFVLRGVVNQ